MHCIAMVCTGALARWEERRKTEVLSYEATGWRGKTKTRAAKRKGYISLQVLPLEKLHLHRKRKAVRVEFAGAATKRRLLPHARPRGMCMYAQKTTTRRQ